MVAALLFFALRGWLSELTVQIVAVGLAVTLILALEYWRSARERRWVLLAVFGGLGAAAGTWLGSFPFP